MCYLIAPLLPYSLACVLEVHDLGAILERITGPLFTDICLASELVFHCILALMSLRVLMTCLERRGLDYSNDDVNRRNVPAVLSICSHDDLL